MATLTEGLLEHALPVVQYHGLNSNKAITLGGSANADFSGSTGTFKTPTGAVTLGNGAISITGAVTLTATLTSNTSLLSTGATQGIGYNTGAGGAVVQATSKSTGVTLNNICGEITMNAAALAATTSVQFTLTNSAIAITDVVVVNLKSGNTAGSYFVSVDAVAAGSCVISLRNYSGGSLSEAVVLSFVVIKAVKA